MTFCLEFKIAVDILKLVPYPWLEQGELFLLREVTLPICPVGQY